MLATMGEEERWVRVMGETLAMTTLAFTTHAAVAYRATRDARDVEPVLVGLREAIVRIAGLEGRLDQPLPSFPD